jgi:hypothetical protein
MKIKCHVLSVDDCGDHLQVKLQGRQRDGMGALWFTMNLQIPNEAKTRDTYRIGRRIHMHLDPQRA